MVRKKKDKRDQKKKGRPAKLKLPPGLPGDTIIVRNPPGEHKMSEVLLEFVEPYSDQWTTVEELKKLLSVAVIVWNATFLPEDKRQSCVRDLLALVPPDARPAMKAHVEELIQRKDRHFADIKRAILSFEVSMTRDGPHVSIMSTLDPH